MVSKKELYEQAKQLKKNGGLGGSISSMNKAGLQKYIDDNTAVPSSSLQKKPKTIKLKIKIKKPKTIKIKIKKPKTIKIKIKKTKKIKIKIKKEKMKSEMQLLKKQKVKPFLKKQKFYESDFKERPSVKMQELVNVVWPIPSKKQLEEVLKLEKLKGKNTPIPYKCNQFVEPFMLLYILKKNKNDCVVRFSRASDYISSGSSIFNLKASKNKIVSNPTIRDEVKKAYLICKKNKKMLVIPVSKPGHANMLIFNYHRDEVELFEPHGSYKWRGDKPHDLFIKNVKLQFIDKLGLNLKFISETEGCPTGFKGFQAYEYTAVKKQTQIGKYFIKDPGGFCCAWSYFYADMRLQYPKLSATELKDRILKIIGTDPEKLRRFIRGQMLFLETEVAKAYNKQNFMFVDFLPNVKKMNLLNFYTPDHPVKENLMIWGQYLKDSFEKFTSN